jgi:hypothetical protein
MELNLNCLPENIIRISGFVGEDAGVMELDVVSKADVVLHHG